MNTSTATSQEQNQQQHPTNGKAAASTETTPGVPSATQPSSHPKSKSTLDRTKFSNPELERPVGERQDGGKQTVIKIRKPEGKFFRIHPSPDTRLMRATVLITKANKIKVLANGVTAEVRSALRQQKAIKDVDIYLACSEDGSYFVTYFSASDHENAESWRDSGQVVVSTAEREWVSTEAVMSDGGYRMQLARGKFPKLFASKPKWELPGEDDPVVMFDQVILQNMIESDNSTTIRKMLESRQ